MTEGTDSTSATDDGVYRDYLAHRKIYVDAELQAYRELDKWLITLSGTGMGLVFAFIKDIVPLNRAIAMGLLPWSLGLMLFAVVACLVSLLVSCSASRSARAALDEEANSGFNGTYWQRVRDRQVSDWATHVTRHLNWIGVLGFVLGAALLISFIGANLPPGEKTMSTNNSNQGSQCVVVTKGMVPPPAPMGNAAGTSNIQSNRAGAVPPHAPISVQPPTAPAPAKG